jgi:hypothetical protein
LQRHARIVAPSVESGKVQPTRATGVRVTSRARLPDSPFAVGGTCDTTPFRTQTGSEGPGRLQLARAQVSSDGVVACGSLVLVVCKCHRRTLCVYYEPLGQHRLGDRYRQRRRLCPLCKGRSMEPKR